MAELHILVIDDKPETRQFIADEVLIPNGFEVEVAAQGIEGLRKTLTAPFNLIIISLEMEPVSGLEILRELRSFDNTMPVVLIASQTDQISLEIVRLGVHDYVKKPIDPEELLNAIENALCLPQLREQKKEIMTRHVIQANQLLEQRVQNLNALYKVGKSITSLMEPSKIMERIIEAVLFLLDGEECSLTLLDPKTGHVEGKFSHRRPYDPDRVAALIEGQIAPTGPVETVLSVPLQVGDMVVGILSLSKLVTGQFTSHDAQSMRMLADYAAIAIHNVQLMRQLQQTKEEEKKRLRDLFERYVAPSVVEEMINDPSKIKLGGTRQAITVLFADVRGFSTFSTRTSPEMLVKLLNYYIRVAAEAVLAEQGTLDKFMGDAVMAFFNAPIPQSDHPLRALRAALKLTLSVARLHDRLAKEHHLHFGVGVGVSQAIVGNIGTPQMMNYTAIGDDVNKVKRLQENAKGGQILIAEETYRLVSNQIEVKYLGYVHLKGQNAPEPVYEVIGVK